MGLELGNLVWQWYLCLIRIAPSPGRSAPYWLIPVVGARSGPSDSSKAGWFSLSVAGVEPYRIIPLPLPLSHLRSEL